jgi:transposase InsO family protein
MYHLLVALISDNGGEYCNKVFDDYCSYHGIRRERTVPGTPQENGVSERMNRTIMEHARSMRLHAGLPLQFWANAIDIFVYLINRGPSSSLDGGIP